MGPLSSLSLSYTHALTMTIYVSYLIPRPLLGFQCSPHLAQYLSSVSLRGVSTLSPAALPPHLYTLLTLLQPPCALVLPPAPSSARTPSALDCSQWNTMYVPLGSPHWLMKSSVFWIRPMDLMFRCTERIKERLRDRLVQSSADTLIPGSARAKIWNRT